MRRCQTCVDLPTTTRCARSPRATSAKAWVASPPVLGDEAQLDSELVGTVGGLDAQLVGDLASGLVDSGDVIGHAERARHVDHRNGVDRHNLAVAAQGFAECPARARPTRSVSRRARRRSPVARDGHGPAHRAVAQHQGRASWVITCCRRHRSTPRVSSPRPGRRDAAAPGERRSARLRPVRRACRCSSLRASAPDRRRLLMNCRPARVMATRTTRASTRSGRRSARPSFSSWVTNEVIEGCVTSSVTARSVNRRGPVCSSVAKVDNAVRPSVRDRRRMTPVASVYSASPRAAFPCPHQKHTSIYIDTSMVSKPALPLDEPPGEQRVVLLGEGGQPEGYLDGWPVGDPTVDPPMIRGTTVVSSSSATPWSSRSRSR